MSRTASCLSVFLLSEDTGDDAPEIIRRISIELLKQVDENVRTNRIAFEPMRDKQIRQVLKPSCWNSRDANHRRLVVDLIQTIATQVSVGNGWVFFHFDGDCTWTYRDTSENVAKFQELIRDKVGLKVAMGIAQQGRKHSVSAREVEEKARARMNRLKAIIPFYSMEAWLFQNTGEAIRLCQERYKGRDAGRFQKWAEDRTALDEVEMPKEAVCLGAAHNLDLASTGFPAREVRAAGRSFTAVVEALSQDSELCDALARTYSYG